MTQELKLVIIFAIIMIASFVVNNLTKDKKPKTTSAYTFYLSVVGLVIAAIRYVWICL